MEAPGAPGQEGMVCGTELICVHTAAWATVTMVWSGLPLFCPSVPLLRSWLFIYEVDIKVT